MAIAKKVRLSFARIAQEVYREAYLGEKSEAYYVRYFYFNKTQGGVQTNHEHKNYIFSLDCKGRRKSSLKYPVSNYRSILECITTNNPYIGFLQDIPYSNSFITNLSNSGYNVIYCPCIFDYTFKRASGHLIYSKDPIEHCEVKTNQKCSFTKVPIFKESVGRYYPFIELTINNRRFVHVMQNNHCTQKNRYSFLSSLALTNEQKNTLIIGMFDPSGVDTDKYWLPDNWMRLPQILGTAFTLYKSILNYIPLNEEYLDGVNIKNNDEVARLNQIAQFDGYSAIRPQRYCGKKRLSSVLSFLKWRHLKKYDLLLPYKNTLAYSNQRTPLTATYIPSPMGEYYPRGVLINNTT